MLRICTMSLLLVVPIALLVSSPMPVISETSGSYHDSFPGPNTLYQPLPSMSVFVDEVVEISAGSRYDIVRVWGTLESSTTSVTIHVEGPHNDVETYTARVAGNNYEVYLPIYGDHRHLEGNYQATVYANHTNGIKTVGKASFYVDVVSYEPPDVMIRLDDTMALPECKHSQCLQDRRYELVEGGVVEWDNIGKISHHIYSVAQGYGAEQPQLIKRQGPNAFDGDIIESGDNLRVKFGYPGSILFTCLFHPWMEGLLVIESQDPSKPDGRDVQSPPTSILDILKGAEVESPDPIIHAYEDAPDGAGYVSIDHAVYDVADGIKYDVYDMVYDTASDLGTIAERQTALEAKQDLLRQDMESLSADIAELKHLMEGISITGLIDPIQDPTGHVEIVALKSSVESWGGRITAQVYTGDLSPGEHMVYLYGPDDTAVYQAALGDDDLSILVQPTWPSGTYTISVSSDIASSSDTVRIASSDEHCIGDITDNERVLCRAGIVTESHDDHILIEDVKVSLAGLGSTGILKDVCHEGATAVVDFDPKFGHNAASVWCDGMHVNRVVAEERPDLRSEKLCETERPPRYCNEAASGITAHDERSGSSTDLEDNNVQSEDRPASNTRSIPELFFDPGGNCPIALLSYGTALAEPVQILREYRDKMIDSGYEGLVDHSLVAYYTVAPYLADVMRSNDMLQDIARAYVAAPLIVVAWFMR